jgi:hypothetical protein
MTAAGAFQSHNRFEVSVEYFCKQATLSVENHYGMGVASMFVIMTAKQLSYVIKGRQNHNEHGTKHSYYEHPFQQANREDYHGKTRQNSDVCLALSSPPWSS